ncbi:MAG: hypothetical protein NTNFB02_10360 [Nitrospira sp.]
MAKSPRSRYQRKAWVDHFRTEYLVPFSQQKEITGRQDLARRALVRGLLTYLSVPKRRWKVEKYAGEWIEDGLLEFLDQVMARKMGAEIDGQYNGLKKRKAREQTREEKIAETHEEITRIANTVSTIMSDLLHHPHRLTLERESDWLIQGALKKAPIKESERCRTWLENNLPLLLRQLNDFSRCGFLDCPRRTTMPHNAELRRWTNSSRGIGALRFHILAHFHHSTFDSVERAFSPRAT